MSSSSSASAAPIRGPESSSAGTISTDLKYAVVREDPRLEEKLLERIPGSGKRVLGVTSAGCTLLQLATREDVGELIGVDINAHQTAWARLRIAAARSLTRKDFCRLTGISHADPSAREGLLAKVLNALSPEDRAFVKENKAFFLNGAFDDGSFERLFACWRNFAERFIANRDDIQKLFDRDPAVAEQMVSSPFWPISFELFFHQHLLQQVFGMDATQHAPPGSYPRYFQARFEWALQQEDGWNNPYLSHILRGRYGALDREEALPDFLTAARYDKLSKGVSRITCVTARVEEALKERPGPYHMIQLSNILDWSNDADTEALAKPVLENLAPGGYVLVRQLNNVRPLPTLWMKSLEFDPSLERELAAQDRSFFYSSIRVGRKPV